MLLHGRMTCAIFVGRMASYRGLSPRTNDVYYQRGLGMKKYLFFVFALIAALLAGCGEKVWEVFSDEISGVWGARREGVVFDCL